MRKIEFASAAREIYHLPLLTMFALHAMLVEIDRPTGGTGAVAPAAPGG